MTTPTKEKLQHALSGARQMLGRKGVEGGISKSRLNQLFQGKLAYCSSGQLSLCGSSQLHFLTPKNRKINAWLKD